MAAGTPGYVDEGQGVEGDDKEEGQDYEEDVLRVVDSVPGESF